jgi:hypothetical protein
MQELASDMNKSRRTSQYRRDIVVVIGGGG